jgi:hypothetical protein
MGDDVRGHGLWQTQKERGGFRRNDGVKGGGRL